MPNRNSNAQMSVTDIQQQVTNGRDIRITADVLESSKGLPKSVLQSIPMEKTRRERKTRERVERGPSGMERCRAAYLELVSERNYVNGHLQPNNNESATVIAEQWAEEFGLEVDTAKSHYYTLKREVETADKIVKIQMGA